jgi:hypothetical protein
VCGVSNSHRLDDGPGHSTYDAVTGHSTYNAPRLDPADTPHCDQLARPAQRDQVEPASSRHQMHRVAPRAMSATPASHPYLFSYVQLAPTPDIVPAWRCDADACTCEYVRKLPASSPGGIESVDTSHRN